MSAVAAEEQKNGAEVAIEEEREEDSIHSGAGDGDGEEVEEEGKVEGDVTGEDNTASNIKTEPNGDEEEEEEEEDDDDIKVTIEDTVPDYNLRAKQRQPQQAKPAAIDLDAGQAMLDVDLNTLEDKPWQKPGADISDYFNYGFDEETWKLYCEKQKKMKIIVSELSSTSETYKIPIVPSNDHSKYSGAMKIPTIVSTEPRFTNWMPIPEQDDERERERERERHHEREKTRDRERERDREKERGRDKEREREKERDHDKERDREKDRERPRERDRDKVREREKRDRSEKTRDRERSHRESGKKRERERSRERGERDKKRKR